MQKILNSLIILSLLSALKLWDDSIWYLFRVLPPLPRLKNFSHLVNQDNQFLPFIPGNPGSLNPALNPFNISKEQIAYFLMANSKTFSDKLRLGIYVYWMITHWFQPLRSSCWNPSGFTNNLLCRIVYICLYTIDCQITNKDNHALPNGCLDFQIKDECGKCAWWN